VAMLSRGAVASAVRSGASDTSFRAKVAIVWDFDAAAGQLNATFPYRWREETLFEELDCVREILRLAASHHLPMTFAITGFAAEEGVHPYHVPDLVREIARQGHEVASHSWRHEWLPSLTGEQLRRSLVRSKEALERCAGEGAVVGFVPPFNRPMTWIARGAVSFGDRPSVPFGPGADMGFLLRHIRSAGFRWCRVSSRSPIARRRRAPVPSARWPCRCGVTCVPHAYCGFDSGARELVLKARASGAAVVLSGHPRALTFGRSESRGELAELCDLLAALRDQGEIGVARVADLAGRRPEGK